MISLLPFASQSSFLYDRQFFQGENAAGLYPCSAYYLANVILEIVFNAFNGMVYGLVNYFMINYQAFVNGDVVASGIGYVGITMMMNVVSNAMVLSFSLAAPNQEVAFVLAAAYTAISVLSAGKLAFPTIEVPCSKT